MERKKAPKKEKKWHMDFCLDEDDTIVIRIDEDTISRITALALGDENAFYEWTHTYHNPSIVYQETIAYWCDYISAEVIEGTEYETRCKLFYDKKGHANFDIFKHLIRDGGCFRLRNCMNNEMYTLTKDSLADGIRQAFMEIYSQSRYDYETMIEDAYIRYDEEYRVYRFDNPDNGADFGDMAFQFALFDDLYYNHDCLRMHGGIRVYINEYEPLPQ